MYIGWLLDDKQWGSFPAADGNTITVNYPLSFSTGLYALVVSNNIAKESNGTVTTNKAYWQTSDTNVGNSAKSKGWYIAVGK